MIPLPVLATAVATAIVGLPPSPAPVPSTPRPPGPPISAPAVQEPQDPPPGQPDTGPADQEPPEPVTPERAERDEEVRTRLQALYDRIESLRDVRVEVEAGIVRLTGEALSLEAREQAEQLARQTPGVVFVENRVRVVTNLGQRLEPALERLREYVLDAVAFVPLFLVGVLIVIGFAVLGSWAGHRKGPHLRVTRSSFTRGMLQQGIRVAFVVTGVLIALELLDATALVGAVLGAAGIFGLAISFAFKDIVENHLAGVMLSLRQPFAPNDYIAVGSHEGKVIRLTARETILMTMAGNHVRIPNAELFRSALTNYTRNPRRRFEFEISVGTSDDLVEAQDVGTRALGAMESVMDAPPPEAQVREIGDSWVTLAFSAWVDQRSTDFLRVRSEALRVLKEALDEAGVSTPSPEYVVQLRKGEPPARAPEPEAPEPRRRDTVAEPGAPRPRGDVSVDTTLDDQIEEDRRLSDEEDLLEP